MGKSRSQLLTHPARVSNRVNVDDQKRIARTNFHPAGKFVFVKARQNLYHFTVEAQRNEPPAGRVEARRGLARLRNGPLQTLYRLAGKAQHKAHHWTNREIVEKDSAKNRKNQQQWFEYFPRRQQACRTGTQRKAEHIERRDKEPGWEASHWFRGTFSQASGFWRNGAKVDRSGLGASRNTAGVVHHAMIARMRGRRVGRRCMCVADMAMTQVAMAVPKCTMVTVPNRMTGVVVSVPVAANHR